MEGFVAVALSAVVAALLVPGALGAFKANGWTRENWQGRELAFPAGAIAVACALVSLLLLAPLTVVTETAFFSVQALALGLGVAFLGLLDDVLDAPGRGWRGHASAVLRGGFSTGALKAAGTLALALAVLWNEGDGIAEYALAVAVVVVCTNVFNLLDLRPGRAGKAFVIVGLVLLVVSGEADVLREIGVFVGPLVVLTLYDLRERAMLGDTGSNLLGVIAGLWIVRSLETTGEIVALAILVAVTVFGELYSISKAIDSFAPLRALDRLGRPRASREARN